MKKQLWITVSESNKESLTLQWMVEVDLNKWFKFVKLPNGRMGFTQIKKKWYQFMTMNNENK